MATTTPAADTAAETTAAEPGADELEFRARHSLTIDPMAHTLLPIAEAKELGAVPLGKEGGRTVVAVADAAESRLAALRELAGPTTKFVLIAPDALNALLKSRIFNDHTAAPPPPPPPPVAAPEPVVAAPPPPPPQPEPTFELETIEAPAPSPPPAAAAPAPEAPAKPRYEPQPLPPPRTPAQSRKARKAAESGELGELGELAAAVAGAAELLASLQDRISDFAVQLDEARREVEEARQEAREHKEKLAVLSAKADQERAKVRTFASGLSKAFAGLEKTKSQLQELIEEE